MRKVYYSKHNGIKKQRGVRMLGLAFIVIGVFALLYFFYPLLTWQFFFSKSYANSQIEIPIPKYSVNGKSIVASLLSSGISNISTNFEDARTWYPKLESSLKKQKVESYLLSIPKLGIENSEVTTIDYDLSTHLVQYFGTSLPGEKGTAVIFGHSSLPQLFSPTNYKTIFSTLHLLKLGDVIIVNIRGIIFTYTVDQIQITDPSDTSMFSQDYNTSNLTLVTCTPPGTVWKRLIIRARLMDLSKKA